VQGGEGNPICTSVKEKNQKGSGTSNLTSLTY
jgi:hypothetical protein